MHDLVFSANRRRLVGAFVLAPTFVGTGIANVWLALQDGTSLPSWCYVVIAVCQVPLFWRMARGIRNRNRPVIEIDDRTVVFGGIYQKSRTELALTDIAKVGPIDTVVLPTHIVIPLTLQSGAWVRVWISDLSRSDRVSAREAIANRCEGA